MNTAPTRLLLADDDPDDCMLFEEALNEIAETTALITVNDGEQLMSYLEAQDRLPSMLFLDLNMPKKNGFECLSEIRANENYNILPVIIISTSYDNDIAQMLYQNGANYYIRKPNEFETLKQMLGQVLSIHHRSVIPSNFHQFILHS